MRINLGIPLNTLTGKQITSEQISRLWQESKPHIERHDDKVLITDLFAEQSDVKSPDSANFDVPNKTVRDAISQYKDVISQTQKPSKKSGSFLGPLIKRKKTKDISQEIYEKKEYIQLIQESGKYYKVSISSKFENEGNPGMFYLASYKPEKDGRNVPLSIKVATFERVKNTEADVTLENLNDLCVRTKAIVAEYKGDGTLNRMKIIEGNNKERQTHFYTRKQDNTSYGTRPGINIEHRHETSYPGQTNKETVVEKSSISLKDTRSANLNSLNPELSIQSNNLSVVLKPEQELNGMEKSAAKDVRRYNFSLNVKGKDANNVDGHKVREYNFQRSNYVYIDGETNEVTGISHGKLSKEIEILSADKKEIYRGKSAVEKQSASSKGRKLDTKDTVTDVYAPEDESYKGTSIIAETSVDTRRDRGYIPRPIQRTIEVSQKAGDFLVKRIFWKNGNQKRPGPIMVKQPGHFEYEVKRGNKRITPQLTVGEKPSETLKNDLEDANTELRKVSDKIAGYKAVANSFFQGLTK